MNRKNIFLWTLYDFANSISVIVFFLYFSQWLVIDNKVPDIGYNLIFVGSSILLLLTSPIFGSISDKKRVAMPYLRNLTVLIFLALLISSVSANIVPITPLFVFIAAFSYTLSNYFMQFSYTFYNAMLVDIAPYKSHGLISGIGQCANWLGEIAGLLITLPLIGGAVFLFGNPGRAQTFLPATLGFFLLALPMLLWFKEGKRAKQVKINYLLEYKTFFNNLRHLFKMPGVGRFLLGYFFFNDAMLTAVNNFPIYLEQVFKIPDKTKSILLLAILVTSAIGALIIGWLADKIGLKRMLIIIVASWATLFPLIGSATNLNFFMGLCVTLGFLYGATWTVTRAVMSYLSPPENLKHAFSYYTMFERFSTFVGPVIWGLITSVIFNSGPLRYRVAMISMSVFIIIGLFIIRSIPAKAKN